MERRPDPTEARDELRRLETTLSEAGADSQTRSTLLRRAAAGAVVVGGLGSAGGALAATRRAGASAAMVDPVMVATVARTAEAMAVTFLDEAIRRAPGKPAEKFVPVLKAAGAAEFDHYRDLTKNTPANILTQRFWFPEAAFGQMANDFFNVVQNLETLFINAYLIGITTFATAATTAQGKMQSFFVRYSRIAGEIGGVEAEHRVLARFAAAETGGVKPAGIPNNKGFETYIIKDIMGVVKALQQLGIGFGKEGAQPGKFYDFPGKKPAAFSRLLAPYAA